MLSVVLSKQHILLGGTGHWRGREGESLDRIEEICSPFFVCVERQRVWMCCVTFLMCFLDVKMDEEVKVLLQV